MKKIIFLVLFFISAGNCFGQQVTFQKTFGGTDYDYGTSVQQTTDGGYIITGTTQILGGGSDDVYLIRTDAYGDSLWTKTFGGTNGDYGYSVEQTMNGGYIITGYGNSFGTGFFDVYLINADPNGNCLWTKTFGGMSSDQGTSVQQTTDGGYIIMGNTFSFGAGDVDIYLIRTDANGDTLWTKTYGSTDKDIGYFMKQTTDGGYIITGGTLGFGAANVDVYLIKTDVNGDTLWTKSFGGISDDGGYCVKQTADGGYIICGYTTSFGAGNWDVYLIKTDTNGDILWTKTFGGTNKDYGVCVQQTTDGGYIIAGSALSFGAGNYDIYLIKTDSNGDSLWTKTFGGIGVESGYFVQQTTDGGYIITGYTYSFGAGNEDVYLIKTDSLGNSGCNEGSTTTIITTPSTQVTSLATIVTSPATNVTTATTIVGSGGAVTDPCSTVGIQSAIPNPQSAITISPNPATNNFTITFPNTINKGVIEIYNVLGEKIYSEDIFNVSQKEIRLNPARPSGGNINAGIYFVKVKDGEKEYCKKLVIE